MLQERRGRLVEDHRRATGSPRSRRRALDHRRFWDAMHAVARDALAEIERQFAVADVSSEFGLDTSSVALDMTNFATFIAPATTKAPIAQRGQGQAETHRPAPGRPRPGRHPRRRDPAAVPRLPRGPARRHPVPHHDRPWRPGTPSWPPRPDTRGTDMTVVFDAGQNTDANFADLAATGLHYVGSVPGQRLPRPAGPARPHATARSTGYPG